MKRTPRSHQRGIATVLMVLLTGLALGVVMFGAIGHVRGLQSQATTVHAATQSELKAWTAVDGVRQFLKQTGADVGELSPGDAISLSSDAGSLTDVQASIVSVEKNDTLACNGSTRVTVDVTGASGRATSTIQAVYCVSGSPATTPATPAGSGGVINGDLKISGGIDGGGSSLRVNGNISGGGSIVGFDSLYATGNVQLSGHSEVGTLTAEGDVDAEGVFSVINSLKNVTLHGGSTTALTIHANGSVTTKDGGKVTAIESIGDVILGNTTDVSTLHTQGSLFSAASNVTSELLAQGDFNETGCCTSVAAGTVGGEVRLYQNRKWGAAANVRQDPQLRVTVAKLTAQSIAVPHVDAFDFKAAANYVFDVDATGRMIVTVHSVSGLTDGSTYFIAGSGGHQDYLCKSATYSAASCTVKVCKGYSDYNSCFTYWNGTWSLNGPKDAAAILAPGVVWFNGNVNVGSGQYVNTIVASGNISTSSDTTIFAVNDAGYDGECKNAVYPAVYPTDYCAGGAANPQPIGEIAMLAGSYANGVFVGGVVDVSSKNYIHGDIVAGDIIKTAGDTTIEGNISAARQSGGTEGNSIGAKTVFKLRTRKTDSASTSGDGASSDASATVLWTRYR